MQVGPLKLNWSLLLYSFIPIAAVLEFMHASPIAIFLCASVAIMPLAALMGRATEALSEHLGPGIGGLLNATFGNAVELIIALMALQRGLLEVVKASITGSIIGNVLLVLGASIVVGGTKFQSQRFNRTAASLGSTLLALSAVGLLVPAIFHGLVGREEANTEHALTLSISVVLIVCYLLSLFFQLMTHKHLFAGSPESEESGHRAEVWSVKKASTMLFFATVVVAVVSEFLIGAVEETAHTFGMSNVFVGVIVLAIIGNAAEHSTAILMAAKNRMDLAMNIAIGSGIQVALFVAPVLVFASYAFGHPLDLIFTPFEVIAVIFTVLVLAMVASDGESHWMEGVLLLAVYVIFGIAFFFLPEAAAHAALGDLTAKP